MTAYPRRNPDPHQRSRPSGRKLTTQAAHCLTGDVVMSKDRKKRAPGTPHFYGHEVCPRCGDWPRPCYCDLALQQALDECVANGIIEEVGLSPEGYTLYRGTKEYQAKDQS